MFLVNRYVHCAMLILTIHNLPPHKHKEDNYLRRRHCWKRLLCIFSFLWSLHLYTNSSLDWIKFHHILSYIRNCIGHLPHCHSVAKCLSNDNYSKLILSSFYYQYFLSEHCDKIMKWILCYSASNVNWRIFMTRNVLW